MLLNELFASDPLHSTILEMFDAEAAHKRQSEESKNKAFVDKVVAYLRKYPAEAPRLSKIFGVKLTVRGGTGPTLESYLIEGRDDINSIIIEFYSMARLDEAVMDGPKKAIEMGRKLSAKVEAAWEKMEGTPAAKGANEKTAKFIADYKEKLGPDHRAVRYAERLGEFGKEHPKYSAAIIGILGGLTSFIGTPTGGLAVAFALRTTLGLAKGDSLTKSVGDGMKGAAFTLLGAEVLGGIMSGLDALDLSLGDIITGSTWTPVGNDVTKLEFSWTSGPLFPGVPESGGGEHMKRLLVPNDQVAELKAMFEASPNNKAKTLEFLGELDKLWVRQEEFMTLSDTDRAELSKWVSKHNVLDDIAKAVAQAAGGAAGAIKGEKGVKAPSQETSEPSGEQGDTSEPEQATDQPSDATPTGEIPAGEAAPKKKRMPGAPREAKLATATKKIQQIVSKISPERKSEIGNAIAYMLK